MQKHNCLSEVCHLSVSAFTYFFSQLIIDSLEIIFYSSLFFFIEVFGCFLWKKKTIWCPDFALFFGRYIWLIPYFPSVATVDGSTSWFDTGFIHLTECTAVSNQGSTCLRQKCPQSQTHLLEKKCFLRIHYLRKKKGQTIEICFTTALVQWLYHIKPQYESWNKIFQFEWIYNYISQFFTVFY